MPAMPSRSLPQARAADGSPIALPPLPDAPESPSSMPGSSEPCASPQAPNRKVEPSDVDSESVQAGYVPEPKVQGEVAEPGKPGEPPMFRIPLNLDLNGAKVDVMIKVPMAWLFRNVGVGHAPEKTSEEGR